MFIHFSLLLSVGVATSDVLTNINNRFNNGKPSSDLNLVGVTMHQWDAIGEAVDFREPWRPYTPEECTPLTNHAHCRYHDRISSLLINNLVRSPEDGSIPLFNKGKGGVINHPKYTTVMCAYSEDGGTMDRSNRGCGCHDGDVTCDKLGFDNSCALEGANANYQRCWWGEEDLDKMMDKQDGVYNELVIDTVPWLDNLPHSIEAFFFTKHFPKGEKETRDIYVDFQAKYPEACVPLLVMDFDAKQDPFSYATGTTPNKGCPDVDVATTTTTTTTTETPEATTVTPESVTTTTQEPGTTPSAASTLQLGLVSALFAIVAM